MSRLRIEVAGVMREIGLRELRRLPGVRHQDAIGVSLAILLDALRVPGSHVTLRSADGYVVTFERSALEPVLLLYRIGDDPLSPERGGPFRLVTPDAHRSLKLVESIALGDEPRAEVLPRCAHSKTAA